MFLILGYNVGAGHLTYDNLSYVATNGRTLNKVSYFECLFGHSTPQVELSIAEGNI